MIGRWMKTARAKKTEIARIRSFVVAGLVDRWVKILVTAGVVGWFVRRVCVVWMGFALVRWGWCAAMGVAWISVWRHPIAGDVVRLVVGRAGVRMANAAHP